MAAQEENDFEGTVDWDGQGSEHATQECPGGNGYWHWILTPGGSTTIETDAELVVEFDDESTETAQGYRPGEGGGAVHFAVTKSGGGTVNSATAHFNGGGDNVNLTISDGECKDEDEEPPENGDDEPPENGDDDEHSDEEKSKKEKRKEEAKAETKTNCD
ncbi:hypothetical protein [Natronosalvus vescus]|uniref:hypothetical protein n=1 Tax=Natronosalvus vescus TaxID=2953881 RepID=UPI002091A83D|nr:hypothetical protein [Natronosalvus vescus]